MRATSLNSVCILSQLPCQRGQRGVCSRRLLALSPLTGPRADTIRRPMAMGTALRTARAASVQCCYLLVGTAPISPFHLFPPLATPSVSTLAHPLSTRASLPPSPTTPHPALHPLSPLHAILLFCWLTKELDC